MKSGKKTLRKGSKEREHLKRLISPGTCYQGARRVLFQPGSVSNRPAECVQLSQSSASTQTRLSGLFSYTKMMHFVQQSRFSSGLYWSENIRCASTQTVNRGEAVLYLFEKGTSEFTVILLLLLSIDTTPPPRFPALPLTLMRSCRNCSWKHTEHQQGWAKVTLTKAFLPLL